MDSYVIGAITGVVILVTVLIFVGGIIQMRHEERKLAIQAKSGGANDAQWDAKWQDAQAEIARLKDRVAVLERLITDEDRRIASEISRLQPSAEARG
jgi:hypothetical protein